MLMVGRIARSPVDDMERNQAKPKNTTDGDVVTAHQLDVNTRARPASGCDYEAQPGSCCSLLLVGECHCGREWSRRTGSSLVALAGMERHAARSRRSLRAHWATTNKADGASKLPPVPSPAVKSPPWIMKSAWNSRAARHSGEHGSACNRDVVFWNAGAG